MDTSVNNEKGAVLILSLMVLAILTILSLAAVMTTTTDIQIGANYRVYQKNFYANEGTMAIIPGVIRRTVAIKTESPLILASLGISDSNTSNDGDGISDTDENAIFSNLDYDAASNGTADFSEGIMGAAVSIPDFTITMDSKNTTVTTTRDGAVNIEGFSIGFATGYEGGALTGMGINFSLSGQRTGEKNSVSAIAIKYQCVERSGGGCW